MKRFCSTLILMTLLALCPVHGQELENLRTSLKLMEDQKQITTNLLSKTQTDLNGVVRNKKLLESKIKNSRNIVNNLERQTDLISTNIENINDTISTLEKQLRTLRGEYADLVYDAYKQYKVNNFMVFLFASKDFNDVSRRINYMRQYNRMRQRKAEEITATATELNMRIKEEIREKAALDETRKKRSSELAEMAQDNTKLTTSEKQLRQQAAKYTSTIQSQQKQIDGLQKQIAAKIAELAKDIKNESRTDAEKEIDIRLTGRFDQNQGQLPYPVKGVVIDRFGTHPHPTQRGIMVSNNGINIACDSGADVKCVFEGEVRYVFPVMGMRNSVMVRHGNYITVYSNLETVAVKVGDNIALNQVIGRLDRSDDQSNFLHFELWRETTKLDPERWLRK